MFLRPRWIASHVFAGTLIVSFIFAGLWQVDRLEERRETNTAVEARLQADAVGIADLDMSADDLEYRLVQVSGTYDPARELLVANRSADGSPGFWAWTVLELDAGGEVIVNRGFVPRREDAFSSDPTAPTTPVIVAGLVRYGLDAGAVSDDGARISRPNPTLAGEYLQLDNALPVGTYVQLRGQAPAPAAVPVPVPSPDLSEGPHLSYAFQWFTFATIGTIGYALVLWRIRRGSEAKGDVGLQDSMTPADGSGPHAV
ncbi:MAG: SURF1 family protein [Acidimicrobiales bacterium]|nr:SURF1 family protein [Acidimicrobiales bacterium]